MRNTIRYILGPNHEAIACDDVLEWARWFENIQARIVAHDTVGHYFVSTVFLGLDHNWGEGPPILWETMIFDQGPGVEAFHDEYCCRYTSHDEAVAGHAVALEQARVWDHADGRPR